MQKELEQTSEKCDYCNEIETVKHFICDCEKYNVLRNVMLDDDINCMNNGKIKIKRLLFPHAFQNTSRFNNDRVKPKIFKQYGKQTIDRTNGN